MTSIPNNPIFNDEDAARTHLERLRWPQGVLCVHCGAFGDAISKVEKTNQRRKPANPGTRPSCACRWPRRRTAYAATPAWVGSSRSLQHASRCGQKNQI
jgi:hypothetical protein